VTDRGVSNVILADVGENEATPRRRGRPPATKSADTHRAILDAARVLFAERGYHGVTNRELAAAAGVTTSALYHYADSKLDLYSQVEADFQGRFYSQFQEAEARNHTFVGKFRAVLAVALEMMYEDPSFARLVGSVRRDVRQDPDVAERLGNQVRQRDRFFLNLVDVGIETGEIAPEDRRLVGEFIRLVLVGMIEGVADSASQHERAIDAVTRLLDGELIRPLPDAEVDGGAAVSA